jgi:hypothetical protein
MNVPTAEDGDPLSYNGQARRLRFWPRRLAAPNHPAAPRCARRGLQRVSAALSLFVTRQVMRLGFSFTHLPLPGGGRSLCLVSE